MLHSNAWLELETDIRAFPSASLGFKDAQLKKCSFKHERSHNWNRTCIYQYLSCPYLYLCQLGRHYNVTRAHYSLKCRKYLVNGNLMSQCCTLLSNCYTIPKHLTCSASGFCARIARSRITRKYWQWMQYYVVCSRLQRSTNFVPCLLGCYTTPRVFGCRCCRQSWRCMST